MTEWIDRAELDSYIAEYGEPFALLVQVIDGPDDPGFLDVFHFLNEVNDSCMKFAIVTDPDYKE